MPATKSYRIGDLARALDLPIENIRYYEHEGLMPAPRRSSGNYRLYGEAEREQLSFIVRCRALDMTLDEIRRLLTLRQTPAQSCADVNALLDEHLEHVTQRIAELRRLRKELKALRAGCETRKDPGHCAVLEGLSRGAPRKRARRLGHVRGSHGR